jgi:hypothetical protein
MTFAGERAGLSRYQPEAAPTNTFCRALTTLYVVVARQNDRL